MEKKKKESKVIVKMIKDVAVGSCRYRKGEIAGFSKEVAERLIEKKAVEKVK